MEFRLIRSSLRFDYYALTAFYIKNQTYDYSQKHLEKKERKRLREKLSRKKARYATKTDSSFNNK